MSVRGDEATVASNARWTALWTSLLVLAVSLVLWVKFDPREPGFQFNESVVWLPHYRIAYRMGVDGISVLFVLLSTILTPVCILASWESIHFKVREFMLAFLVLETMLVGMFCAADFVVFYMFFEGVLIPMYLIIGIWGGPRRVYAAVKFFLYTLAGSVLMLLALIAMWLHAGTTDISVLMDTHFPVQMQNWLFFGLMASSRSRCRCGGPHLVARRACRGADRRFRHPGGRAAEDGRVRFPALLSADAARCLADLCAVDVYLVGDCRDLHIGGRAGAGGHEEADRILLGRAYGRRNDWHLYVQRAGHPGCAVSDVVARDRFKRVVSRRGCDLRPDPYAGYRAYGGLADRMPAYALIFMTFTMATMGLPATSGFVGEFLVIIGAAQINFWLALLGGLGMILGAAYSCTCIGGSSSAPSRTSICGTSSTSIRASGRCSRR